jgi:hypothetical protein
VITLRLAAYPALVPERLCSSDNQEEQPQKKLQDPERNVHTTLSFAILGTH